jgi:hypothetical protein
MSVSFTRKTALQIIANEKMGFSFGVPERPDENSLAVVLPILRDTPMSRNYLTLSETDKVDIADTGNINKMRFTNKSTENVFVRSGTIVKGGTQERAITRSAILLPGKTVELECRCIHASRGIQAGSKVSYGGLTSLDFDQMSYDREYRPRSQSTYWSNVNHVRATMMKTASLHNEHTGRSRRARASGRGMSRMAETMGAYAVMDSSVALDSVPLPKHDDFTANLNEFAKSFADLLSKVKCHENQVGLGLISDKGCETIELFDLNQSWKALHEDAVKRMGSNAAKVDTSGVFEYKADKAVEAVKKVLGVGYDEKILFEHRASNGEPSVAVIGLSNEKFTGEIVELDGRVMHLTLLRMVNA